MIPLIILFCCFVALGAIWGSYWHTPYEPKKRDENRTGDGDDTRT
jgi:hypothetical protein